MLLCATTTEEHLDLLAEDYHPNLLVVLMKTVVKGGRHVTVKSAHPNMMSMLAQVEGKHLTRRW